MRYRKFSLAFFVSAFIVTVTQVHLRAGVPEQIIKEVILKDSSSNATGNIQNHKIKLWEDISPSFSFDEMSKRAMGKYWKDRLPHEKSEFVQLFARNLKNFYISKENPLFGKKIVSLREIQSDNFTKVETEILTNTGKEITVVFYLLNKNEEWKIYDVMIEGVSLVKNYHNQFKSILARSSFDGLIQKMKQKQDKIYLTPDRPLVASYQIK
ncbi:MAG: ABC transporter substrate-binding protein [Candidatus Scalindua sp.]|nr:ABC transporter substrate-binding protein [Candidatus Scalindua sp.]